MNSRLKEELERTWVTKTEEEKERERELHQGTRHWPAERDDPLGAEKVDVRASRENGGEDNAQIPVLYQGQGNATEANTAVRAAAHRTEDHSGGFEGANQRRSASEHPRHAQRRGSSEGQPEKRMERQGRQHRVGRRDGRSQRQGMAERRVTARLSTSRLKRRRKDSALRNARVDPG